MLTSLNIIKKIKNSLRLTVGEAISSSAVQGFGNAGISSMNNQYISAYALALKATNSEISFILAVPLLVSSIIQIKAADLIKILGTRKRVAVMVGIVNILLWVPFILIPVLFRSNQIWWFLAFFTLITVFWTLDDPAWDSLISDLVPLRRRGKFFGHRKLIGGIILLATSFIAGYILNYFQANIFLGFIIIFSLAMLARCISWILVTKVYEPPMESEEQVRLGILDFIKDLRNSRAGKVILLSALMNLAIYLSSPFYSVYMLQEMKVNILVFTMISLSATAANLLTFGFWGKKIDRIGPMRIIALTSLCIAFIPLLWTMGQRIPYLMMVQFFSGFLMAGFNLSIPAFIYIHSSPEKRAHYLSYLYALNMGMAGIGTLAAGFLVSNVLNPQLLSSRFLDLFLISGVLSGLVAFSFVSCLIEVPVLYQRYFRKPKNCETPGPECKTRIRKGLLYHIPRLNTLTPAYQTVKVSGVHAVPNSIAFKNLRKTPGVVRQGLYYRINRKQGDSDNKLLNTRLPEGSDYRRGLYYFMRSADHLKNR